MRKLIFSLAIVGSSYSFSFYKMCGVIEDQVNCNEERVIKNITINGNKLYYIFDLKPIYDTHLKYGLFTYCVDYYGGPPASLNREAEIFDRKMWHKMSRCLYILRFKISYLDVDFSNNHWVKEVVYKIDILDQTQTFSFREPIVLGSDEKYKRDLVEVWTKGDGVTLKNLTGKVIRFEEAFKKYVRSQKEHDDQYLFQHTTSLARDLLYPVVNDKNQLKTDSFSKIRKLTNLIYTDDQIELLENSEILAIWTLPEKYYSNKDYVENWNKHHPDDLKEVEYKKINRIIIGSAVDTRTNEAFNFITDLGQDISVLFNYDN